MLKALKQEHSCSKPLLSSACVRVIENNIHANREHVIDEPKLLSSSFLASFYSAVTACAKEHLSREHRLPTPTEYSEDLPEYLYPTYSRSVPPHNPFSLSSPQKLLFLSYLSSLGRQDH